MEFINAGAANPEKSASAVTAPCELFIPLGELVDVEKELARLSLMNTAQSGVFAADRAIAEYARDIWNIKQK